MFWEYKSHKRIYFPITLNLKKYKFIHMKKKRLLFYMAVICCSLITNAQTAFKGVVVDQMGKPLQGVVIEVVGSESISTISDINGEFSIPVSKGSKLNAVSSKFDKKQVLVNDNSNIKIVMDYTSKAVDMGTMNYSNMLYSTASVSTFYGEELTKSSAQSLQNALFGKGLGLNTSQSGAEPVIENAGLSIRGLQSLSDNGILVLVDGVERPIDNLTTDEVESISILKDAAALALHGYKGRNGVLSVRTKRGVYNQRSIQVSYEHAFRQPVRLPDFADAYTYGMAMNEASANDGKPAIYSAQALQHYKDGDMPDFFPNVDWVSESYRNKGHANKYDITFQGGNDKLRYFSMVDMTNDQGFLNNTDKNKDYSTQFANSRLNVRTNLDVDISNSTKLQVNLMGIVGEYNRPNRGSSILFDNIYTLPSAAHPIKTYDGIWGGNSTWTTTNPVAGIQGTGFSRAVYRSLFADMTLTQSLDFIAKGLNIAGKISYDNNNSFWDNRPANYTYASDTYNFATEDTIRYKGGTTSELGFSNSFGNQYYRYTNSVDLNYKYESGKSSVFTSLNANYDHYVGRGQNSTLNRQNFSWLAHYGYDNRYIADLVLNLSGSNRLPKSARYNLAPTVSAAWVASNEEFLKDISWINFLKVRASAGIAYTDYVPNWNLETQAFSGGTQYFFADTYAGSGSTAENRLAMTTVLPERATRYNLGADMTMFGGLTVMLDIYKQRRDHQFVEQGGRVSSVLGMTSSYANAGIVDSKGIELGLDFNKKMGDVTVSLGAKVSYNTNTIVEQLEAPAAFPYLRTTGLAIGQPFGLEALGFFADQADIDNSPIQKFSQVKPGDIKYKDQNGDGFIDQYDKIAIGKNYGTPETYYSINLGLEYKSFGFDALLQGVTGTSAMPMTKSIYKPLMDNTTISNEYYNNRWTPATASTALYPRLTTESNDNNYQSSTLWLKDASFLKLRHCELYYKLPKSFISKSVIQSVKVYVRAMDLILMDHIKLSDPEVIGVNYPTDRSLHLGASVIF